MVSFMFPKIDRVKSQKSVQKCHAFIITIAKIAYTISKTSPAALLHAAAGSVENMQNAYQLMVLHQHLQIYAHLCKNSVSFLKTSHRIWNNYKTCNCFSLKSMQGCFFMLPKLKGVKSQNSVQKCHAFINTITKITDTPSKTSPVALLPAAADRFETMQNAYHLLVLHHHLQIYAHLCKNYV